MNLNAISADYHSGAGTNLKVGAHVRRSAQERIFFTLPLFWLYNYNNSRIGKPFRGGQYSLVSFLFAVLLLTVPPVPSHL